MARSADISEIIHKSALLPRQPGSATEVVLAISKFTLSWLQQLSCKQV